MRPYLIKTDVTNVFRSIFMRERLQDAIPCLQQMVEGLELYGLLDIIRANADVFRVVFCPNKWLDWTFEKLEELFVPVYSTDGSSSKVLEINSFKALIDAVEICYEEGTCIFVHITSISNICTSSNVLNPVSTGLFRASQHWGRVDSTTTSPHPHCITLEQQKV